jgi:hypothetical protein
MGNDVERIQRTVSLTEMARKYGVDLKPNGREFWGCCPFHNEKSPSFQVYQGKISERFKCQGCGADGDVIGFVMRIEGGVSMPEAIRIIDGDGKGEARNTPLPAIEHIDPYADIEIIPADGEPLKVGAPVRLYNPKRKGERTEWGGFKPSLVHPYRLADGSLFGYVLRHDMTDGKETPMVMRVRLPDGVECWSRFPFPKLRPLYGLDTLDSFKAKQVIILEGEKCKDALQDMMQRPCVSWAGGTQGVKHTDWSPLTGKSVIIWPDLDGPGRATALEIAAILHALGCTVKIMNVFGADFPKGWDAADAIADGWGLDDLKAFMKETVYEYAPPEADPEPEPGPEPEPATLPAGEPSEPAGEIMPAELVPEPDDDLAPEKIKRELTTGVAGIAENMPRYFGGVEYGSEVELSGAFLVYLSKAAGGALVKAEGKIWAYGPDAWHEVEDHNLRLACHGFDGVPVADKTPLKLSSRMISGVIAEMGTKITRPDFFERSAVGVNTLNGSVFVSDFGAITLKEHNPDDRFRFTIDAKFGTETPTKPPEGSLLHKLLYGAVLGDPDAEDKVNLIGEIMGAASFGLATRLKQPKAFIFHGVTASNGKSTIAGLLQCLLPKGAVSAITPANLSDDKRLINLAGKAANVANEISAAGISGEIFKTVVTGEPVEARDLYSSAFTFKPRAVHLFTANKLPSFNGGIDRGLQRRLVVVQFNRTIPDDEVISDILERIEAEELHLLLGFAVGGAQRLKANGGYTIPGSSEVALKEWMQLDPINEWLETRCEKPDEAPYGGWPRTGKLYEDFKSWAVGEGHKESFLPSIMVFVQKLAAVPGVQVRRHAVGRLAMGLALLGEQIKMEDVF